MATCLIFVGRGLDGRRLPADGAVRGRHGLHRRGQRRRHLAGPEDRLPRRRHARAASRSAWSSACVAAAAVIGLTVQVLDTPTEAMRAQGIEHAIGSEKFPAPQGTLMATLIKGLLAHNLDWQFVLVGVFLSITMELCGVKSLSFAVGAYLPLSTTSPIFVGGAMRGLSPTGSWRRRKGEKVERGRRRARPRQPLRHRAGRGRRDRRRGGGVRQREGLVGGRPQAACRSRARSPARSAAAATRGWACSSSR